MLIKYSWHSDVVDHYCPIVYILMKKILIFWCNSPRNNEVRLSVFCVVLVMEVY